MIRDTAIIVPCYNEAHRLNPHVYCEFLRQHHDVFVIFVNDGSTDSTQSVIESIARDLTNAETLRLSTNQGKNVAVREGFLRAFKRDVQYIGYWDADLSTPLSDILEFRREMDRRQYEVLIGSRVKLLGLDIQRKGIRHHIGRIGATLISMVLNLPIYDTQCGAKLFRNTPALQNVFSYPFDTKWLFDVEIIARFIVLSRSGDCQPFPIIAAEKSLAVWRHTAGSKINASSFASALFDLIRIQRFLKSHRAVEIAFSRKSRDVPSSDTIPRAGINLTDYAVVLNYTDQAHNIFISMVIKSVEIGIILLTLNQREKTLRFLESFRAVIEPSYKIILWDNGSEDSTIEAVVEQYPDALVHHHPQNIGVASGRNEAVKLAIEHFNPLYLLFIDNDMTVDSGFLVPLVLPFENDPNLAQTTGKILDLNHHQRIYGAGGCRIRFWRGDTMHRGYGEIDKGQYDKMIKCYPSGGCMLVRNDIFQKLGGFDNVFDPYGPEDLDFGLRVQKAGYYGLYVPQSIVYHETKPGHTFEGGQYTEIYARNQVNNWFIFMMRHALFWEKLVFVTITAPFLLLKVTLRELGSGNISALKGLFSGALEFLKSQSFLKIKR